MATLSSNTIVYGDFDLLSRSFVNRGVSSETASFLKQMFLDETCGDVNKSITAGHCKSVISSLDSKLGEGDVSQALLVDRAFSTAVQEYIGSTGDVDVYADLPAPRAFSVPDVMDRSRKL